MKINRIKYKAYHKELNLAPSTLLGIELLYTSLKRNSLLANTYKASIVLCLLIYPSLLRSNNLKMFEISSLANNSSSFYQLMEHHSTQVTNRETQYF